MAAISGYTITEKPDTTLAAAFTVTTNQAE